MSATHHGGDDGRENSVVYHGTRWDKRLYVGYLLLLAIVFAPFLFNGGRGGTPLRVLAGLAMLLLVVLAIRARNYGTIRTDVEKIEACGAARCRSWKWEEVDQLFD